MNIFYLFAGCSLLPFWACLFAEPHLLVDMFICMPTLTCCVFFLLCCSNYGNWTYGLLTALNICEYGWFMSWCFLLWSIWIIIESVTCLHAHQNLVWRLYVCLYTYYSYNCILAYHWTYPLYAVRPCKICDAGKWILCAHWDLHPILCTHWTYILYAIVPVKYMMVGDFNEHDVLEFWGLHIYYMKTGIVKSPFAYGLGCLVFHGWVETHEFILAVPSYTFTHLNLAMSFVT